MTAEARIRGVITSAANQDVNVRSGAGTSFDLLFKALVGTSGLAILAIQADAQGQTRYGKVYHWYQLRFPNGTSGWVRDDLLEIQGDLRAFGLPVIDGYAYAHPLIRFFGQASPSAPLASPTVSSAAPSVSPTSTTTTANPVTSPSPVSANPGSATSFPDALADTDRIRKLAFQMTGIFEGRGYASYQNFDSGVVSYGFIQFTLSSGSLAGVVTSYLSRSQTDTANKLRAYQERINARDALLRNDTGLRDLLIAAAAEVPMQQAQEEAATVNYWQAVVDGYITPRNLRLPLTWALLFDMGVNFGVNHGFVRLAEKDLNVVSRSRIGENGITEEQLMSRVAQLRKESHDRQAERDNLPGLKRRGDFWMNLVQTGDWYLRGTNGTISVNGSVLKV